MSKGQTDKLQEMTERLSPKSPEDVRAAVEWAAADGAQAPLEIIGAGTKRGWGGVLATNHVLDVSALAGVSLYEPDELVLSAGPGTRLSEIEEILAVNGQQLAFEPPDLGALWSQPRGAQTLGGVLAANLSGPRRVKAGAARDHFLGFHAVTGRAEAIKSGGRVVKNVTGYDLCKLFAGSFGTLGVMTEVTVKVLPAGEKTRTVLIYGLDDPMAIRALTNALNSSHEVSGAAHLPGRIARRSSVGCVADANTPVTAVRVEGVGPSVEHRCAALRQALGAYGDTEELHGHNSRDFWREVGGVARLLDDRNAVIWRLSVPPKLGPAIAEACEALPEAQWYYDWGGGLIWLSVGVGSGLDPDAEDDGGASVVRQAVAHGQATGAGSGHATLMRAPERLRQAVPPMQPQSPGVAAIGQRLREQFDPFGILNPGRMAPVAEPA